MRPCKSTTSGEALAACANSFETADEISDERPFRWALKAPDSEFKSDEGNAVKDLWLSASPTASFISSSNLKDVRGQVLKGIQL